MRRPASVGVDAVFGTVWVSGLVNGEHPNVVQEMLGHTSITLTMDSYSHVLPGMQEKSAAWLDALLAGTP